MSSSPSSSPLLGASSSSSSPVSDQEEYRSLRAVHTGRSIRVLAEAFPEACYWDCRMGVMHTIPDCKSIVTPFLYMYKDKKRTPVEARGGCARFGGVCEREKYERNLFVHQIDAFAPRVSGLVYTDADEFQRARVYHADARCTKADNIPLQCTTIEESLERGDVPCALCN